MKKLLMMMLLVVFVVMLVACGSSLSKEKVISKMEENESGVKNYNTQLDFKIKIMNLKYNNPIIKKTHQSLKAKVIEPTMAFSGVIKTKQNGNTSIQKYYSTKKGTYANLNKTGWKKYPNKRKLKGNTLYNKVQSVVQNAAEALKMKTKDNLYVFSFTGKSKNVFNAFKGPYSIDLTGKLSKDDVKQDVLIKVDKETFMIKSLKYNLTGKVKEHKLVLTIKQQYDDINNIDKISIPEKVIKAAQ